MGVGLCLDPQLSGALRARGAGLGRLLVAALVLGALLLARREGFPPRQAWPGIAGSGIVWFGAYIVTQLRRGKPLLRQADEMSAPHTLDGDVHGGRESGRAVLDDLHVVGDPAGPLHDLEDAVLEEGRAIRDLEPTIQRPPGRRSSWDPVTQSGRCESYRAMKASKIAAAEAPIVRSELSACPSG
jgi:hypothetical protein